MTNVLSTVRHEGAADYRIVVVEACCEQDRDYGGDEPLAAFSKSRIPESGTFGSVGALGGKATRGQISDPTRWSRFSSRGRDRDGHMSRLGTLGADRASRIER